jgi:predicted transcriptional regulator
LARSESEDIRKLLRHLLLLRIVLFLSFIAALGTTVLTIAPTPFQPLGYGPLTPGPTAQTAFVSTTLAASATQTTSVTTVASTTLSFTSTGLQGGHGVIYTPTALNPVNYYGFTALISWTVFGAALIWRGHVRSVWGKSRFSYDTFRLLVKMRGAQTRLKLMRSLDQPRNKLQLANALGIDWKAVDKHVQVLEKNRLIQATSTSGTATFYEVTEKGRNLIQLLDELGNELPSSG